jgi:PAS domain S-box-containing protein
MTEPFRILILEDHPADVELIQFELHEAGLNFISKVVATEKEYVQAIQDYCPDLILSDYDLPKYNGALALVEAGRRCPDTPFILVSGVITEDRAIEILTQGAKDYVLKTRLQQRLVPAVKRALAEAEEHEARRQAEAELREAHRTLEERVKTRTAELEAEMTERKKIEDELQMSERREHERAEELATILDAVPTPVILVHDPDSTHMTGNRSADELLQQQRGSEASLSAPPGVKPRHFKAFKGGRELKPDELPAQRAARGEQVKDFEFSLVFDDGATRDLLGYGTPLLDKQQRPRGAVHVLVDITERKRAEDALKLNAAIMETVAEGIFLVGLDDNIIKWTNRKFEQLFGYGPGEMVGMHVDKVNAPTERTPTETRISIVDVLRQAGEWHGEIENIKKDGTHFWCRIHVSLFNHPEFGTVMVSAHTDITERKQAEEALRGNESILHSFFDSLGVMRGIVEVIAEDDVRHIIDNAETASFIGLTPEAMKNKKGSELGEPRDTLRIWVNHYIESQQSGKPVIFEYQDKREDREVWLEATVSYLGSGPDGHPRFAYVVQDITESKRAEKALQQITERLDIAQQAAQIGTWDWDVSTGHIEWSNEMFSLFGLDQRRCTPSFEVWKSIIHPEDNVKAGRRINQALKKRTTLNSDYRIVLPDGQIRWINAVGKGKYNDQGRPTQMTGVCMDITTRKRMEDDLRKTKAGLEKRVKERTAKLYTASLYARSLIEASLDPLVTISADGEIMDVNHTSEEMTGINRQELIGKDFSDYFTESEKARAGYEKVFRDGFVRDYPLDLKHRDGHVTPVLYNASVYRDETGKIMGVFAAARDISERKRAEETVQKAYEELEKRVEERTLELTKRTIQLQEANKELESFSYSVSHDLRAPLRAIEGYSRMILKQQRDKFDEDTRYKFNQIMENRRTMGQLIDDLLALSRFGRDALSLSGLNVGDLSREVWEELRANNPDCPAELKINPVPLVVGDRSLIRQVLINLLTNAIKFSRIREVPLIAVGGHSAEGENIFYVRDNGVGFDMRYYDKLFGAFQRLHSRADYEGTGIGLAIVHRIIQRHGGRVWAESAVDKGATFYCMLPSKPE